MKELQDIFIDKEGNDVLIYERGDSNYSMILTDSKINEKDMDIRRLSYREGLSPIFMFLLSIPGLKDIKIFHAFYEINQQGIQEIKNYFRESLSKDYDVTPSGLESRLCKPYIQESSSI